jgi:hypothetical protein
MKCDNSKDLSGEEYVTNIESLAHVALAKVYLFQ